MSSDLIALVLGGTGLIISVIGLVIAPKINLKSKQLEKRLEFRIQLFQEIFNLWEYVNENETSKKMDIKPFLFKINKQIQLFGYNEEIRLFNQVVVFYNQYVNNQTEENRKELILKFNLFFKTSFNTYRKEVSLEKLSGDR